MNWKSTAILTGVTALAGWLGVWTTDVPSDSRRVEPRDMPRTAAPDIEDVAARLRARTSERRPFEPPVRNAFTFGGRPGGRPVAAPAAGGPPEEVPPAPDPFRLTAIATDTIDGTVRWTAVVGVSAGVMLVNVGDTIGGYRVESIDEAGVVLEALEGGDRRRLSLRP